MLLYDHFFGAYKNIYLDYDYPRTMDGHDELPVRFTRINTHGDHDTAETIAPACDSWDANGFTYAELVKLERFLADNMASLLAEAEQTRGDDAHMTTMDIEFTEWELLRILRASYLSGMAPGEFIVNAAANYMVELERDALCPAGPEADASGGASHEQ